MSTFRVRITDEWLPFPSAILGGRQWRDGDLLELEMVEDVMLVRNLTVAGLDDQPRKAESTGNDP